MTLPTEVQTIWWITLGVGVIVAIVVVVLLQTLLNAVKRIERNADALWTTATMVARNTATTWVLADAAQTIDEIKAEALRHDTFLSDGGET